MNLSYLPFSQRADALISDSTQRAKITTTAIALAHAYSAPMPTAPTYEPVNYYNMQLATNIAHDVSGWNENIIFDLKECLDQVRKFWLIRYNYAYPQDNLIYDQHTCFAMAFSGINNQLSQDQQDFMEKYKAEILPLSLVVRNINSVIKNG